LGNSENFVRFVASCENLFLTTDITDETDGPCIRMIRAIRGSMFVLRALCVLIAKFWKKLRETAVQKFPYSLCGKDAASIPIPMGYRLSPMSFPGMARATLKVVDQRVGRKATLGLTCILQSMSRSDILW
jgi:hypothetical protein